MKDMMALLIMAGFIFVSYLPLSAEIKVLSVKGSVAYKSAQKWEPLKVMMRLNPGTKVSTGVASSAVIQIDKHTITIDPMTMIKIYEHKEMVKRAADKEAGSGTMTKLGLKRGSISAKIFRDKRVKTEFQVASPVATSSVRGTWEKNSYGPSKGHVVIVKEGLVQGENKNGSSKYLQPGMVFHQQPGNSDPEPLLADIREKGITSVFVKDTTTDEKNSRGLSSEEFVDNSESPDEFLDSKINSNVSLFIIW